MPDNTIDTLSIDIQSSSKGATTAINKLVAGLAKLNGALNNYDRNNGQYGKALLNLEAGFVRLNSAISRIDTNKLNSVAKSVSSLSSAAGKLNNAFGNTGMDKATRDAQAFESEMNKAVKSIMSTFGTSGSAFEKVKSQFESFFNGLEWKDGSFNSYSDGAVKAVNDMVGTMSKNVLRSSFEEIDETTQRIVDYVNSKGAKVNLPFKMSEVDTANQGNKSVKSRFAEIFGVGGWTTNGSGNMNLDEYIKGFNESTGMNLPADETVQAYEKLESVVLNAKEAMRRFSEATVESSVDSGHLLDELTNVSIGLQRFKTSLESSSSDASTGNPFSAMANGLRELQGINVPDLTGVSNLAGNIGKLANKKASAGIQILPSLVSGLQSLNSLQGITIPDLTGLAELIAVIGKLGGKKGNAATANIQPMITGLQQLSSLSGISFPDSTNLASLANAFSMLGRSTTGNAIQNIPQLATAFRQLMQTLSTAPKVSQNVIDLANALAKLSSNGAKVGTASRSLNTGMQKINSAFDGVMQRSKAISTRIMDFGKKLLLSGFHADSTGRRYETLASKIGLLYAKFWMLIRAVKGLNGMIEVASSLTEVQNVVDTTFGKMSGKLEEFAKNSIKNFGMSELSAKQYASQFQAMGNAMGITGQQVANAQKLISTKKNASGMVAGYNEASNSMADMSINLTKLTSDMASFYDVEQSTVAKALQSGIMAGQTRPLRQYGIDLTNATLAEWAMTHGLNSNIKSMTQAEKTMLRYQYVMYQTTNAQGDFSKTANTWHNQITILKQQLQQLAAVIGSGLIQAIKPFVMQMNAALSGLISFAQKVVNALGKIFGWEMEVNTKGLALDDDALGDIDTSGLDDIADGADNATQAVKKLKDQLQGFDKLNVLRTTTTNPKSGKSGSGSGSGTPSGTGAVSDGDISANLKKTKGVFESNIDNLFDLGRYISNSLAKQLQSIKWDKIYEKARGFGTGLANFLNGLITPLLFSNVGRTVANSLNTAFHFLDSFGYTFNWSNFGKSIGAGINGFFKNIDWGTALSAAKNWGKGIADAINSFIDATDFYEVGKGVVMALKTAITFWLSLGSGIKWKDIGSKLADAINGAVEKFPAKELADTIDAWVQGIRDLFVTLIGNIKWGKVKDKILEMIKNLDFDTISIVLKTLALVKGASFTISIGRAIMDAVAKKFVENLAVSILAEMAKSPLLSKALGKGLGDAATKAAGSGYLGTAGGGLGQTLFGGFMVGGGIYLAVTKFLDMWNNGWSLAKEIFKDVGIAIALGGAVILGIFTGPIAVGVGLGLAAFSSLAIGVHEHWDDIKKNISNQVGNVKKEFSTLKEGAGNLGKDLGKEWESMKTDFSNLAFKAKEKFGDIFTSVATNTSKSKTSAKDAVRAMLNATGTDFESMRKKAAEKLSALKTDAESKWSSLKTNVGTRMTEIKTNVSNAWTNIKTTTGNLVGGKDSILSKAREGFNSIKSAVKDRLSASGGLRGIVSDAWESMRDNASRLIGGKGDSVLSSVKSAFSDVKDTIRDIIGDIKDLLDFDWSFPTIGTPYIKKPHFTWDWKDIGGWVSVPTNFHVEWYKKAYDNPYMFTNPTIMPNMRGFGDGNGGEIVYGHQNLMDDIRTASGSSEMTNIGNRQLANDQRIIQLLTIIAEKEFGISQDQVFRAVRNGASDYTMRTGRSAFEF